MRCHTGKQCFSSIGANSAANTLAGSPARRPKLANCSGASGMCSIGCKKSRELAGNCLVNEPNTRCHDASLRCWARSEEHTSELQSRFDLVCRLLLEKK